MRLRKEHRKHRAPAVVLYEVERRDKRRLAALTLPFAWSERGGLVFTSRERAEDFVREVFGVEGAKMAGIRVVRA